MAGEAGLVRAAWPPLEEEAHFMKAMRMGVPPVGHSCPSRVPSQLHSRTSSRSGKKKFGARHEKTLEGKRLKGAPGSEDQALPRKRSWSLSTPLFSWLGFKEVTYYSASALSPRRQTQPLARLNPSGGWEGGMKDL